MGDDPTHRRDRREVPVDVKPEEAAIADDGDNGEACSWGNLVEGVLDFDAYCTFGVRGERVTLK